MKRRVLLAVLAWLGPVSITRGLEADGPTAAWPRWLGPTQDGVAVDPGVFSGKASVRLQKAWSYPLESGQAGLAVADGRVFTLSREGSDDYAVALRADTGALAWRVKLDAGIESPWVLGPPSTPTFAAGRLFTLSSACRLRAHDASNGHVLWEFDVKGRFDPAFPVGCASSPFVEGDRLYLQAGGREDHRLAAFDVKSGEVAWTAKGVARALNASPIAADLGGVRQIVSHHSAADQRSGLTGFRLTDGAVLWSSTLPEGFSFDTPRALPGDRVALQTVSGLNVLRVSHNGEAWSAAPLWRSADLQAAINPPVFHAGHLFGFAGDDLVCVDAETGATVWKEQVYPGSLILVDGHLVVLSTSAGLLRVVEASAAGYREKARLELLSRGAQALAPPSYAGHRIFVRNEEEVAAVDVVANAAEPAPASGDLRLRDFKPRSMLRASVHEVPRAAFPAIDIHNHVNDAHGDGGGVPPAELVASMDRCNMKTLVILTGGWGDRLQQVLDLMAKPYPGRFVVFTEIDWSRIDEPGFGESMVRQVRDAVARGARGLKIKKELGLVVRDHTGRFVAVDDPRLDPVWEECGRLGIPVAIHTSDPDAFFLPLGPTNERYEELVAHPDWSFSGEPFPSKESLLAARNRVFARHPRTTFIALHVANHPEDLDDASAVLDRYPNVVVETGARQAELGRQPRRTRAFFLAYQDRILFGTDARPEEAMYRNWFRWLETADESFDYWNAPAQGRWTIYGLELPATVLDKVYRRNAERVFAQFKGLLKLPAKPR
jgi:predicted TIM-barrel fold metal-dependent hydrolase/outer membrane protein assembly factor BamB